MTVHVGELTSEVQVQGGSAGGGAGAGGAGGSGQPTWEDRVRMARMLDDRCREKQRTEGERFDD